MSWIALKILLGDKSKYFTIIFGVSFACFLKISGAIAEEDVTQAEESARSAQAAIQRKNRSYCRLCA
ncbi:MAG TPA: hypothetical protein VHE81_09120 [Lacipirellulaceae bacterium]|nr:hypothetical protein [Lacipirellulaceae bacterium]